MKKLVVKIINWIIIAAFAYGCYLFYFPSISGSLKLMTESIQTKDKYDQPFKVEGPLRISFVDWWEGFDTQRNFFIDLLEHFQQEYVIDHDNPEMLFYSVFGQKHLETKYNNVAKIQYTGESYQYNTGTEKDLILGYDESKPNQFRLPMWHLCVPWFKPDQKSSVLDRSSQEYESKLQNKTKFTAFIYSNSRAGTRNQFFHQLSTLYKTVDSGGQHLNNLGYLVKNKQKFYESYKFVVAFENLSQKGYTTEKILHSLQAGTIPIYWGNEDVARDFNSKAFINAHDYATFEELIDRVKEVDNNQTLYEQMVREPILAEQFQGDDRIDKYFDQLWNRIALQYQQKRLLRRK